MPGNPLEIQESRKMLRNSLAISALILLGACSSAPPVYKSKETKGCGIAEYNLDWIKQTVADISWSGGCADGVASGDGVLIVHRKDGRKRTFKGRMLQGRFFEGELTREEGHIQRGLFYGGALTRGQFLLPSGALVFDGEFANNMTDPSGKKIEYNDQRYYSGTLFVSDSGRIEEGRFDNSAGIFEGIKSIDPQTGEGIIWGKFYRGEALIFRWVNGRLLDSDQQYSLAVSNYIAAEQHATGQAQNARMAEARQKDAQETREALAQLNASLAALAGTATTSNSSKDHAPRATAQPLSRQPSHISSSTAVAGSGSPNSSSPTNVPAVKCLSVTRPPGRNWALMRNNCPYYVTVDWCYAGAGGDCSKGDWGGGNLGSIPPNSTREASTFSGGVAKNRLYFTACSGRDSKIKVTSPSEFHCP